MNDLPEWLVKKLDDHELWCKSLGKQGTQINLVEMELKNFDLSQCNLLSGLLYGAKIIDSSLFNADLTYAALGGAELINLDMRHSSLVKADLSGTMLKNCQLNHARLIRTSFVMSSLENVYISESKTLKLGFSGAILKNVTFRDCSLQRTSFEECSLENVVFENVDDLETIVANTLTIVHGDTREIIQGMDQIRETLQKMNQSTTPS